MSERPILFSGPMVLAILDGRKTVTRRIVKLPVRPGYAVMAMAAGAHPDPGLGDGGYLKVPVMDAIDTTTERVRYPSCVGDRLWVQEAHTIALGTYDGRSAPVDVRYHADSTARRVDVSAAVSDGLREHVTVQKSRGRPGRFMPRWASRILLEVASVRAERLHEITEEDAKAEGVEPFKLDPEGDCWTNGTHRTAFEYLWNEIHGWAPNSWASNPWVWRVEFRRVS